MAGTKVPAKFEQGGFTSGRRKGPQTLFPGASPGNHAGDSSPKLNNSTMPQKTRFHHSEFLLARLQKPQCSWGYGRELAYQRWARDQLSRVSATLRSRKSRNT